MINAIREFKELVAPEKTRVESLFPLIFVFGGDADVKKNKHSSCRNVFLHWAAETKFELGGHFRIPEHFPQWNHFEERYNLVDFELDVGCLSRGIVLFLESPGALAELGAFCKDDVLCEHLLVVIGREHYEADSFIKWGPVQRIADEYSEDAICVVETTKIPKDFEEQVALVGNALREKVASLKDTRPFVSTGTRDKFLLIADLVELFGALTEEELGVLLEFFLGAKPTHFKRMLKQLVFFELIIKVPIGSERYYVPPKKEHRIHYLKYTARAESKFERVSFKLTTIHPELKGGVNNKNRLAAYAKHHGVPR